MNGKVSWLLSLFCASFFAVPAFAQCKNQQDRPCWSLQYILYAAETDFREFRGGTPLKPRDPKLTPPNPDLSVGAIHVPCHTDIWLSSEVPVYMCSAEVSAQEAEEWYAKTMADLHELQYLWHSRACLLARITILTPGRKVVRQLGWKQPTTAGIIWKDLTSPMDLTSVSVHCICKLFDRAMVRRGFHFG